MRTEITRYPFVNQLYAVEFTTYDGLPRYERIVGVVISAPLFKTCQDAVDAGNRALDELKETHRFPNLCVPF